jgi:hypothetical protein
MGEMTNAYVNFVIKLGESRRRPENNIRKGLREVEWGSYRLNSAGSG